MRTVFFSDGNGDFRGEMSCDERGIESSGIYARLMFWLGLYELSKKFLVSIRFSEIRIY